MGNSSSSRSHRSHSSRSSSRSRSSSSRRHHSYRVVVGNEVMGELELPERPAADLEALTVVDILLLPLRGRPQVVKPS